MYKTKMQEVIIKLANYPTAIRVWMYLWDLMKKDGTIRPFKQKELCDALNTNRQIIYKSMKKLKELDVIREIDGELRYNPYIFLVSGMNDKERFEAQKKWSDKVNK